MVGILKFTLPEEQIDFQTALDGNKLKMIIHDHYQYIRTKLKYCQLTDHEYQIYEECKENLLQLLNDENLDVLK